MTSTGRKRRYPFYIASSQLKFAFFILTPYFLEFLLPLIFIKPPVHVPYTHHIVTFSQMLYGFFVACIWFGLVFFLTVFPFKRKYAAKRSWSPQVTLLAFFVFTAIGVVASCINYLFVFPSSLSQIVYVFLSMPPVAIIVAIYFFNFHLSSITANKYKIQLAVILAIILNAAIMVVFPLLSGSVNLMLFSVVAILFAYALMRASWKKLALAFLLLVAFASLAQTIKIWSRMHWYHGEAISKLDLHSGVFHKAKKSTADKGQLSEIGQTTLPSVIKVHGLYHIPFTDNKYFYYPDYIFSKLVARLDALPEFSLVVARTPSQYSYWHAYSYKMIPAIFIPRMFWHDKPVDHVGTVYAHRYSFIEKSDNYTQEELGGPAEAWTSYGWLGIVVSALIFGLILRVIWMFFVGEELAIGNIVIASVVVLNASRLESDAAMVLGNLFHSLIIYWALEVFVRRCLPKLSKR